jgi:hypothetical protein
VLHSIPVLDGILELGYLSGVALDYRLDDQEFESWQGLGISLSTTASRPALGLSPPSIQWVPWALSLGESGWGMKLTTHLHLVPRSKMYAVIPPFPSMPSWHGDQLKHRDNFTFYLYLMAYSKAKLKAAVIEHLLVSDHSEQEMHQKDFYLCEFYLLTY